MYGKYQEAVDALRHEQLGRKHSEMILERVGIAFICWFLTFLKEYYILCFRFLLAILLVFTCCILWKLFLDMECLFSLLPVGFFNLWQYFFFIFWPFNIYCYSWGFHFWHFATIVLIHLHTFCEVPLKLYLESTLLNMNACHYFVKNIPFL